MSFWRIRVKEEGPFTETFTKYLNGGVYATQLQTLFHESASIEDVNTPDYYRKAARGEIVNSSCVRVKDKVVCGGGSYTATHTQLDRTYTTIGGSITLYESGLTGTIGEMTLNRATPILDESYHDRKAKIQAIRNMDPTPYAFMEDAAEIRETLRFLKSPAAALLKLARRYRRDARLEWRSILKGKQTSKVRLSNKALARKVADTSQDISDVWLAYRFAATPLVRSLMDGFDALNVYTPRVDPRQTARGRSVEENRTLEDVKVVLAPVVYDMYTRRSAHTYTARAGILYEVTNPLQSGWARAGFRIRDVPETIWAVMPFSFMVDRVLDLTSMIRGLTNLVDPTLRVRAAFLSKSRSSSVTLTFREEIWTNGMYIVVVDGDDYLTVSKQYERDPWTPLLSDTDPVFDMRGLVKDATSVADLLTLAISAFRLK